MRPDPSLRREAIQKAIAGFKQGAVGEAARRLLDAMGYHSGRTERFPSEPDKFLQEIERASDEPAPFRRDALRVGEWREGAFVFQLTNDEIPFLAADSLPLAMTGAVRRNQIESLLFFAIDLGAGRWSRTDLAKVAREINRRFPNPAVLIFRHGASDTTAGGAREAVMSMAVIDRRANLRDGNRDVIESRIAIIKDVTFEKTHRAHIEILFDLSFDGFASVPSNFRALYENWMEVLSTETLNKKFYRELSLWFLWAAREVDFPKGGGKDKDTIGVIRLLTRLIFIWFIKELKLVPDELFDPKELRKLLKDDPEKNPESNGYYLAVLQNLFFATLNVDMGAERKWADSRASGMKGDFLVHSLYRHKDLFKSPDDALKLFLSVPFLNGGLFECLDREVTDQDVARRKELKSLASKEGSQLVLRVDGFSRRPEAQPKVPNRLFFGDNEDVDLNDELGTRNKTYTVRGLLRIFRKYKFTVDENTPVEEEVALDPELLGKVFENLLASYNEDTKVTARKLSGSFYTPRVVVDYMVDEALLVYLARALSARDDNESRLRALLGYRDDPNPFTPDETAALIAAIEKLKLLDPACGSGAFPMGALAKLVHVLAKLDPDNVLWRRQNRLPLEEQLRATENILDPILQEQRRTEAAEALETFDRTFDNPHHASYTRKLYLIEKCIHGVDIQPIAVQIAKLRFFISLVVSQEIDRAKPNCGVTALPNLETKIIAADTLMNLGDGGQQLLRSQEILKREKELAVASKGYFGARTHKTKQKYRARIGELRDGIATLLESEHILAKKDARRLVSWDPFDQNSSADFFDPEWMFQMTGGFGVVLGNPPYVRQERFKDRKDDYQKAFPGSYSGTADLYVYFYERSIKLLEPDGAFAFITSNKWYRSKYGEKLREWMKRETRLLRVIDFGDAPVFDAIAYPTIVIAQRRKKAVARITEDELVRALNWSAGAYEVKEFPEVFARESFVVPQGELKRDGWQLEVSTKRRLLDRVRAAGVSLGEYVGGRFYNGVKTGLNEPFILSGGERDTIIQEDPKSVEIIKPFLQGRDVKRWEVKAHDQWIIYIPWHFPLHEDASITGASDKAEREFKRQYPAIYKHLQKFKSALEQRDQTETGIRYEWYALQRPRADIISDFESPKIFVPTIEDGVEYALDRAGLLGNDKTSVIVCDDPLYVLAVLNSSISWWVTRQTFSGKQGGFYEFKPMYVGRLPVPAPSSRQLSIVKGAVVAVLSVTESHLERFINGLVYELFFPEDLHAAGIKLFDAAEAVGVGKLAALRGNALAKAAQDLVTMLKDNGSPLFKHLFNLRALEVVRIIEEET